MLTALTLWMLALPAAPSGARADEASPSLGPAGAPLGLGPAGASLDALFREAWQQSPAVLRARADVEAAEGARAGARVWLPNPQLQAGVSTDAPLGNAGELDVDVGITQQLVWPGGRFAAADAADAGLDAARARLAAARLAVAADVEAAVAQLVAARESRATREELARVARAMATSAKRRLDAGAIGQLEASLVAADAATAASATFFAAADVRAAENALCAALGRAACGGIAVEWPALAPVAAPTDAGAAERLDVRAAEAAQRAAEKQAGAASVAWLPTATLGAGYSYERGVIEVPSSLGVDGDALVDGDHLVGATLSITLPTWDWRRQDVLAARAQATRAAADAREAAVRAQSAVPAALAALEAATAAVEALAAVQDDVRRALVDLERAYDAGAMPLDEALVARDRLLQAQLGAVEARRRRVAAHADVLRALSAPLASEEAP